MFLQYLLLSKDIFLHWFCPNVVSLVMFNYSELNYNFTIGTEFDEIANITLKVLIVLDNYGDTVFSDIYFPISIFSLFRILFKFFTFGWF